MNFKTQSIPCVIDKVFLPVDIHLSFPKESDLPQKQKHFLLYLPWNESYLQKIPLEYQDFFIFALPYLRARTTDVHTAICLSYLENFLIQFPAAVNQRVVALALILHDSGWSKLSEAEIAASLGVTGLQLTKDALASKEKHAIESEKIARELLGSFPFQPPLTTEEFELICKAVLYHDKPEAVAGAAEAMPFEVQTLVDLDHIWSFTHENFWQDTVRKGVEPSTYANNLGKDLESYFVTDQGKALAKELLSYRLEEVAEMGK